MNKALIVIDYTNDFVATDGALTCGAAAQQIEPHITALAQSFVSNNLPVVFAIDKHKTDDQYHPESLLFPPHNICGTEGRKLYGALNNLYELEKHNKNVYYMDKTRYSAFAGTELYLHLNERQVTELHVCGVCTDICVLHTLVDAYNLGFRLVAHEKCMASFSETGHKWALNHFKNCLGAAIV